MEKEKKNKSPGLGHLVGPREGSAPNHHGELRCPKHHMYPSILRTKSSAALVSISNYPIHDASRCGKWPTYSA
jgi:hypothetical protein